MAEKKNKKKKKKQSRLLSIIIVLITFVLLMIPISLGIFIYLNSPPAASDSDPPVGQGLIVFADQDGIKAGDNGEYFFDVRRGETARSVGMRLERAGIIRNRQFWYLLCRFREDSIKTGTYRLVTPATQMAIHSLLVSGRQVLHRVTIPEGVTLRKTAKILEDAGICSAGDFLTAAKDPSIINSYRIPNDTMEGYLFPDTYLFPGEYPADMVLRSMADTFFDTIEKIDPSVIGMTSDELNQKVIIASIVEREYRVPEEAPLMAGVFYNRLGINMALQSCATVEYIITEIQERPHPSVLYNRDLEIRSPYNTYMLPGLPPGPISAPGATALQSAFSPEKTEFLYFRLEDPQSGRHYFSKTLDEHIRAGQLVTKGQP